jgi:hypothetical protein
LIAIQRVAYWHWNVFFGRDTAASPAGGALGHADPFDGLLDAFGRYRQRDIALKVNGTDQTCDASLSAHKRTSRVSRQDVHRCLQHLLVEVIGDS